MNDFETFGMLRNLVEMSENNFRECVEFINNAEVSDDTKRFFEILIALASRKRQEKRQSLTAQPAHRDCQNTRSTYLTVVWLCAASVKFTASGLCGRRTPPLRIFVFFIFSFPFFCEFLFTKEIKRHRVLSLLGAAFHRRLRMPFDFLSTRWRGMICIKDFNYCTFVPSIVTLKCAASMLFLFAHNFEPVFLPSAKPFTVAALTVRV